MKKILFLCDQSGGDAGGEKRDLQFCDQSSDVMAVVFSVTFLGVIGILEVSMYWHV